MMNWVEMMRVVMKMRCGVDLRWLMLMIFWMMWVSVVLILVRECR